MKEMRGGKCKEIGDLDNKRGGKKKRLGLSAPTTSLSATTSSYPSRQCALSVE